MNYSQKIARAFEISGYILLAPAIFGAGLATIFIASAPFFTLVIYTIFITGCVLLAGYFKHSRGRLDEKHVGSLWIVTAVYNAILMLPVLAYGWYFLNALTWEDKIHGELWQPLAVIVGIISGYLTTIVLSIAAYRFDRNERIYL